VCAFGFAMSRDIFQLPLKPALFKKCIDTINQHIDEKHGTSADAINAIVTPEAKGFVFGSAVAAKRSIPFIPIRKAGKLLANPGDLIQATYTNRKNKVRLIFRELHHFLVRVAYYYVKQKIYTICSLLH